MKKKPKAQNGYIATPDWYQQFTNLYGNVNPDANQLQNVQITAQGNPNQRYLDIGQPQQLPIDNQVQAQPRPLSQKPYQGSYNFSDNTANTSGFSQSAGNIAGGIAQGAYAVGNVLDTLGDIKRGIIKGGASILNALIPDTHNKRPEVPIMAYNPDPYGNQQYNNIYENGGYLQAKSGIHINPEHKGDFTEWAKRHGMSVKKAADHVMANRDDYSPHVIQMANFAKNASKWDKAKDGKTITVYDKNDPRYRAYQDSLNAYKFSKQNIKDLGLQPGTWYISPTTNNPTGIKNVSGPLSSFNDKDAYSSNYTYKNWQSDNWVGRENNINNVQGRTAYLPVYPKPSQQIILDSNIQRIPELEFQTTQPNIQTQQLVWDNVYPQGKFPLYGNDNRLIGNYDTNLKGQTYFYPNDNYSAQNQGEAIGLPPNTIIPNNLSTTPTNIRRMKDGGKLSASKAKEILRDGTIGDKKITNKQKRYFGFIAGGGKAANGAIVTDYGYGNVPNLTPAQEAALNGTIPYTTPIERIEPQPISDFGYYSPNPNGTFAINIDRHLMDRSASSGYIGDTYSYGTNRAFGYEGLYGNKDYQPQMFMDTGYNRYFENGGTLEQGQVLNLTKAQRKYYESLGYEFE